MLVGERLLALAQLVDGEALRLDGGRAEQSDGDEQGERQAGAEILDAEAVGGRDETVGGEPRRQQSGVEARASVEGEGDQDDGREEQQERVWAERAAGRRAQSEEGQHDGGGEGVARPARQATHGPEPLQQALR